MKPYEKIKLLQSELGEMILERENQIEGSLGALLSGANVLLLGPPGTAKSMMANAVCGAITGAKGFSYLMTKFTTPEELFGPFSYVGLKEDRFTRVTKDKAPEAHVLFLDEVFKGSSAISNTLLGILNERVFFNGSNGPMSCPLLSCFGASNELPKGEELGAYNDRFILRYWVNYLTSVDNRIKMCTGGIRSALTVSLSMDEIMELKLAASQVKISQELLTTLLGDIVVGLTREGVTFGDRKQRNTLPVLKAIAYLRGQDEVTPDELEILADVVWEKPEQRVKILKVVSPYANPLNLKAIEFLDAATEILKKFSKLDKKDENFDVEGVAASRAMREQLDKIDEECRDRPVSRTRKLQETRKKIVDMQKTISTALGY